MAIDRPNEPERPVDTENVEMGWGSEVVAELVRRLDIPYIAVVPGASYRGFQDSLVNYLGNRGWSACTKNIASPLPTAMPRSRTSRWRRLCTAMWG